MKPILEAIRLSRRHPTRQAWLLHDVSFTLPAGAILGIMGPTGAGKSLLLRSLAQLDPPDAGEVRFHGQTVTQLLVPVFRSQVIYLHQNACLMASNVEQVLRQPFELRTHAHRTFDRQRILDYLGDLEAGSDFLRKSTSDLSGGEQQIVALLRAIQLEPQVLLLDEPTAALDSETAEVIENLLKHWLTDGSSGQRRDNSVVWVTHSSKQAERMADRILIMREGKLENG